MWSLEELNAMIWYTIDCDTHSEDTRQQHGITIENCMSEVIERHWLRCQLIPNIISVEFFHP